MKNVFVLVIILGFAAPVKVAGQLFPFDRRHDGECTVYAGTLTVMKIDQHLKFFGLDSVTLEIYFDPVEVLPTPAGWAYKSRCLETCFLSKKRIAGSFFYPVCPGRRYTFLFYRDGCYLEFFIEPIPGEPASTHVHLFGRCPPPKISRI